MMEWKKLHCKFPLFFKTRRSVATLTASTLNSHLSSSSSLHKDLCNSLLDQLISRGLFSPAQQVLQRIITRSSSVSEVISIVDFASERGLELDLITHGVLLRKFVFSSRPQLAEVLFCDKFIHGGMNPDASILDSMVICFCRLGKFDEAVCQFNKLLSLNYIPSKDSFNTVFRELCAQGRVLEAFEYLVRVNGPGVYLGCWCFNVLIDGLCYKGYMEEALELFDMMHNTNGFPPTLHLFKSLFYGLCKRGWLVDAELLIREMELWGLYADKTMYTSLIREYCKDKKMKMAMQAFFRMMKIGCEPDNYTLNTLIHGFVKMGLVDEGWSVYNLMTEWRIQPDVVTFQIMINKYCQEGKVDSALTIFDNMVSCNVTPRLHCYTVLINALHRDNRLEEVDMLFKNILENGIIPDHVLFFILMKVYPKGHELQLALTILEAILKNGCGKDSCVILASKKLQSVNDIEQKIEYLLEEIVNENFNQASVAFSIFISALCESGKTDAALQYLHQMDYGTLPDTSTYLIIINEYCRQGDVKAAYYILEQMSERGLKPSVAIYDSIIGCLSRKKQIFEAESVFQTMLEAGVDPDKNLYLTMINGYCKNGRPVEALELFEKMVENSIPPDSRIYTALVSGLVKKNMTDKGCVYLDKMLRDGLSPNAVFYTALIQHFLKIGEVEYAFRLVDLMERSQIEPDVIFYITLVSGVCKNLMVNKKRLWTLNKGDKRAKSMLLHVLHETTLVPRENNLVVSASSSEEMKSLALKLIQKVKDVTFMPNLHLYNSIICGCCRTDRILDANRYLELMQKEGLCPNQVTFTILMDGHILAGDVNSAIGLFNKMNAEGCIPDRIAYDTLRKGLFQGSTN